MTRHTFLLVLSLALLATSPAAAQIIGNNPGSPKDVVVAPPAKTSAPATETKAPATEISSPSITGVWRLTQTCPNKTHTANFQINTAGPDGISGHVFGSSNNVESQLWGGGVDGRAVRFNLTFHILGKRNDEEWTGTLSADGQTISGSMTGFWVRGCTFVLSR